MPLINWKNLPVDSLDGVSSTELDFLSELSAVNHSSDEILGDFIDYLTKIETADEAAAVSSVELPELSDLPSAMDVAELESLPSTTREHMFLYGKMFVEFLKKHGAVDVSVISDSRLAEFLRFFYFCLKKSDGSCYSPATLVCIRAGVQRYSTLVLKRRTNIISSDEFATANRMLRVKVRHFHADGGTVNQHEPIEEGDLQKMRAYFDRSTAERLQDEVLFTLLYVLGERGQEHLSSLKQVGTLQEEVDADGNPYLALPPLKTKNQTSDPTKCKGNQRKQSRIYGAQRELILHYQSLLPQNSSSFFPRPLTNNSGGQIRFSATQVRGVNWLAAFMKHVSSVCNLSKQYTNHCIRVTRIADLFDKGMPMGEIMAVTGQRSESTVRRYLARKRDRTLRKVATAVSDNLAAPTDATTSATTSATVMQQAQVDLRSVQQPMFANCLFDGCTFKF
ncbi:hypothetical protein BOX15_Mlig009749g2 [Macrostomum lignano]|uniref:Tyr recombinase domain-containing protein n=1 Tax=Macrostomum lignano TaxID=282301 RepID=A0A267EL99_9PLAT|nr:hypothetical protein BOX15_Mlig009749g2 [Macrostomum lignano]